MGTVFPTVRFAAFFVATWAVLTLLRGRQRSWRLALLAANWVFYLMWAETLAAVLALSVVGNHLAVRLVARAPAGRRRRAALSGGIVANLAVLAAFKYYGFFATGLTDLLRPLGATLTPPLAALALPLGISFFTFAAISYLVEVHRGDLGPAPILDEAVWLTFFPTVVSGPLTRPSELLPQLATACDTPCVAMAEASMLFVRGMFKKVVIAGYLTGAVVDQVFADPRAASSIDVAVAVYAYAAVVFADFSGYTDMARGAALLLGIRLPENFDQPYRATSIQQFWTRWHMTLSRWIRDFLFFPLGRRAGRSRWRTYRNLVVVMVLVGLWHGAAWTFVAFGLLHGLALMLERLRRDVHRDRLRRAAAHASTAPAPTPAPTPAATSRTSRWSWSAALGWFVTFHVICLGWVLFRAASLSDAATVLARLAVGGVSSVSFGPLVVPVVLAVLAVQFAPVAWWHTAVDRFARLHAVGQVVGLAGALTVIDALGPIGVAPFIYFRF